MRYKSSFILFIFLVLLQVSSVEAFYSSSEVNETSNAFQTNFYETSEFFFEENLEEEEFSDEFHPKNRLLYKFSDRFFKSYNLFACDILKLKKDILVYTDTSPPYLS